MKSLRILLVICLILGTFAASLEAGYIVKRTVLFTARVNVTGNTNTALIAQTYTRIGDVYDPTGVVTWTNINLPMPAGTKWRVGNHYVKMIYTNFVAPWGITLATENTNGTIAHPKYTGGSPDTAGLVASNTPNVGLQLAWQIQQLTSDYQPCKISDPTNGRFTNTGWAWKYMLDQAGTAFTNRSNNAGTVGTSSVNYYAVPIYSGQRLWGSAATERAATSSPAYFYLAADFTAATIQVFKTTALTLEMYKP